MGVWLVGVMFSATCGRQAVWVITDKTLSQVGWDLSDKLHEGGGEVRMCIVLRFGVFHYRENSRLANMAMVKYLKEGDPENLLHRG